MKNSINLVSPDATTEVSEGEVIQLGDRGVTDSGKLARILCLKLENRNLLNDPVHEFRKETTPFIQTKKGEKLNLKDSTSTFQ